MRTWCEANPSALKARECGGIAPTLSWLCKLGAEVGTDEAAVELGEFETGTESAKEVRLLLLLFEPIATD